MAWDIKRDRPKSLLGRPHLQFLHCRFSKCFSTTTEIYKSGDFKASAIPKTGVTWTVMRIWGIRKTKKSPIDKFRTIRLEK